MRQCQFLEICSDTKRIRDNPVTNEFGDSAEGITSSHNILCRTSLHGYCSLFPNYVFRYLLDPELKEMRGEA